jgi:hypothetical protein
MLRRASSAHGIALLALFISLGGAGYSATGGNFLLGRTNTATTPTVLVAPLNGRTLQINNVNAGLNATPLALVSRTDRPPMAVNSLVKVANLNADRLDGLDSTHFPRSKVVPFDLAPGAISARINLPVAQRAVFVMGTTFVGGVGVGQVSLLRTGYELRWTGTESYYPGLDPHGTYGASSTQGDHIVYIDNRKEVDIEVNDANSIRIHNGNTSVARTGNVTLIW